MPTLRWHSVLFPPKFHGFNRCRWVIAGLKIFDLYVKRYGVPDIIHAHSIINAGFLAYEISKKYNIPFVVTEHSTRYVRGLISNSVIEKIKPIIRKSEQCLAVSKQFCKVLNHTFGCDVWKYVPNMVNNNFLEYDLINEKNNFTFINICLLDKKKNIDLLLYAFAKIHKKIPNVLLKIGGEGPEKKNLIRLVSELNISKNVQFLGLLVREQVIKEIADSSAFVLSSNFETFGVVIVEALALGKPVVATKCGGPESIINSKVGYLVEKNSIDDLAEGMFKIYTNRMNFKPEDVRNYCKNTFSEKAVVNQLGEIYRKIIQSKNIENE